MKIINDNGELKLQISEDKIYDFHYSFRIAMIYESKMKKNLELDKMNSVTDWFMVLYAVVTSTLKYNKSDITITEDELEDIIDDSGNDKIFVAFIKWYLRQFGIQDDMIEKYAEKTEDKEQVKKN